MPVRDATMADIPALLTIYNEVVANTTAIYDQQISTLEERQKWFEARRAQGFPILVMESGGEVSGFRPTGNGAAAGDTGSASNTRYMYGRIAVDRASALH